MALSFVKASVLAATMIVATASASMAATWGQIEVDSALRQNHNNFSAIVNSVDAGDIVQITNSWGLWYKVKVPGPDGWIRKNKVDVIPAPVISGGEFCFSGPLGYFCFTP